MIDPALSLLSKAKEKCASLMLPEDVVIADKFPANAKSMVVPSSKIPFKKMGLDIGPAAVESLCAGLDTAKTIIWNGPLEVSELDSFAYGTKHIARKLEALTRTGVKTIIAGDETVAAFKKMGLTDKMSHISTGGCATLELLEGIPLPALMALDDDASEKTGLTDAPMVELVDKMMSEEMYARLYYVAVQGTDKNTNPSGGLC